MDSQKGSVKIEGLKLLGYLTSEHLQNMAQVIINNFFNIFPNPLLANSNKLS